MLDVLLFVVFPYVAVAVAVAGAIYRYLTNQFSFTSLSSQFLESDVQFWGSTLWHYGTLPTLVIHVAGFTLPKVMVALHSTPETLYLAELAGKVFGIMALVGAASLFYPGRAPKGPPNQCAGRFCAALSGLFHRYPVHSGLAPGAWTLAKVCYSLQEPGGFPAISRWLRPQADTTGNQIVP